MDKLIGNIPWDRLSEGAIITVIAILVIYFIFKKYINHENKRIDERISEVENIAKVEIEKVNKEVSQIKKNVVTNSEIDVLKGTQLEENEISDSSIKVR
jgi:hypothetical protein